MLANARSALGRTFTGYKGGAFTMDEFATCWIAPYGEYGSAAQQIGHLLMDYMLAEIGK